MKYLITILLFTSSTLFAANYPKLNTVPYLNVQKYLGTWHEVARLPVFFQLNCYNATANYELIDEKSIKVTNACKSKVLNKNKIAYGKAEIVDSSSNSKLLVSFESWFQKLFPELAKGDYWVLEIGESYSYAVVGAPSRKFLWFLSRSPQMDKSLVNRLKTKYKKLGFPTHKMKSYSKN